MSPLCITGLGIDALAPCLATAPLEAVVAVVVAVAVVADAAVVVECPVVGTPPPVEPNKGKGDACIAACVRGVAPNWRAATVVLCVEATTSIEA